MSDKEKRFFKRYKSHTDVSLILHGKPIKAEAVDYSADGIGMVLEDSPLIERNEVVELHLPSPKLDTVGMVVWVERTGGGTRVGLRTPGPVSGSIKDFWLSDILIGLQRSSQTGVLEVKDGSAKKIYVKDGSMIFAISSRDEDRLGDVLLEEGVIDQKQYDESVDLLKETKRRQGTILVELGYLTPSQLVYSVKHQVERIIVSLFECEEGAFRFKEGPLPTEEVITLHLSAANLIYRGIKALGDEKHIREMCPPASSVLCFSPHPLDLFQDIKLDSEDEKLLFQIDGRSTLREILERSHLKESETLRTIYALLATRMIDIKDEAAAHAEHITPAEVMSAPETTAHDELIERIEDIHRRYRSMGYYGILGVKDWATDEMIKKAYYRTAKEFHPDRNYGLPIEMKEKLNEIFAYVTTAYSTLINPKGRKEYDKVLRGEPGAFSAPDARSKFESGKAEMGRGKHAEAAAMFAEAAYLDTDCAKYHYYYGKALLKLGKYKDADKAIQRALRLEPGNADFVAEAGHVYLALGFDLRAKGAFEKALEFESANGRAKEGLDILGRKV